jgi:uncharacterized membrane protein YoaK (UPF0700 family)
VADAQVVTEEGGPHRWWHPLLRDPRHGPLPALLLTLTVVTGLVDAVSILSLGRVFVANMTGNVVFVGFALAGAPGFSLAASLFALAGFLVGALGGGRVTRSLGTDRARLVRAATGTELALLTAALTVSLITTAPYGGPARDAIAGVAAVALGLQNAVVRKLGVPDLTTTVLTMTLTGIASDLQGGGGTAVIVRRILAVALMPSAGRCSCCTSVRRRPSASPSV